MKVINNFIIVLNFNQNSTKFSLFDTRKVKFQLYEDLKLDAYKMLLKTKKLFKQLIDLCVQ